MLKPDERPIELSTDSSQNDFLQWLIVDAYNNDDDPDEREIGLIVRRLLMTLMAAVHTSSLTISNAILDIWGSEHSKEHVQGLREESERVFENHGKKWTKGAVDQLVRVDSAL